MPQRIKRVKHTRPVPDLSSSRRDKKKSSPIALEDKENETNRPGFGKSLGFETPKRPALSNTINVYNLTPVSRSKKELSPTRRKFLKRGYTEGGERQSVPKLEMEKILDKHLPPYPQVDHDREKVFLNMSLFDFDHTFLARQKGELVWETNQERMARGAAPICYRGYVDPKDREGMSTQEIFQKQRGWNIELHHLTLDMSGYGILMVVNGLHLGGDAAYLVKFDGKELTITQSGITKKDRENLDIDEGYKLVANVLHPANGSSKIDRGTFDKWRTSFWKALGNGEIKTPEPQLIGDSPFSAAHQRALLMAPKKLKKSFGRYNPSMSTRNGLGGSRLFH